MSEGWIDSNLLKGETNRVRLLAKTRDLKAQVRNPHFRSNLEIQIVGTKAFRSDFCRTAHSVSVGLLYLKRVFIRIDWDVDDCRILRLYRILECNFKFSKGGDRQAAQHLLKGQWFLMFFCGESVHISKSILMLSL